jgi:hypothetical protein
MEAARRVILATRRFDATPKIERAVTDCPLLPNKQNA